MPEDALSDAAARRRWVRDELGRARRAADPWPALERAHIVSQPYAALHTRVHLAMLTRALAERSPREIVGQLVRVLVAGPGSLAGRYPRGNTGRVTMGLMETAEVSPDLVALVQ